MKSFKGSKILEIFGRKRIIAALIILITILSIITAVLVVKAVQANKVNKDKNIVYTENSKVGYEVFLKENEFFEGESLGENKQYIASLIEYVKSTLTYELKSSEASENFEYKYKIVAETNVTDKSNNNQIYKLEEELVPEITLRRNNTNKLVISETIDIDYHKYNDIIKRFINVYNLDDITPTLTIKMYVNVKDITKSTSKPVASVIIPLTTKTVAIDIQSNSVNATELSVYKEIANKNYLYIAVLTFILTAMIGIELYIFVNDTKDDTTIYKMRVKKILQNYDSYIQRIDNDFNYEDYKQLEVKTFEDLLQIRDTISEPILMMEKNKETDFLIPSKGNVIYTYKLTVKDIKKERENKHSTK